MKQPFKFLWLGLMLSVCPSLYCDTCCATSSTVADACSSVKTGYIPMSGANDLKSQYHKAIYTGESEGCGICLDPSDWQVDLNVTYRFQQTHNGRKIAEMLFGDSQLIFQGSDFTSNTGATQPRRANALVADYFGLPSDTNATLSLHPRITNNIVDIQLAINMDKLYFQINAPIMYSKWKLDKNCGSCKTGTLGTNPLEDAGTLYFVDGDVTSAASNLTFAATSSDTPEAYTPQTFDNTFIKDLSNQVDSFDYLGTNFGDNPALYGVGIYGNVTSTTVTAPAITPVASYAAGATGEYADTFTQNQIQGSSSFAEALNGFTFGNLQTRSYNYMNLSNNSCESTWKLADLILQLGYDLWKCENKHFGLYLKAVIPTGTCIDSKWAKNVFTPVAGNGRHFELGAGASAHIDFCERDNSYFSLNLDGYLVHVFKKKQFRTFDNDDQPMSRFALVKQLSAYTSSDSSDIAVKGYSYAGNLFMLGDVNAGCVDVSADVRGEAVADLIYTCNNWELGLGYAFAGQSKEKVCGSSCLNNDGYYYGYKGASSETTLVFYGAGPAANTDNIQLISEAADGSYSGISLAYDPRVVAHAADSIYHFSNATNDGSIYATVIPGTNADDVFRAPNANRSGLMDGQMLHRIFGHVDYVWSDCCWQPQLGVLGSFGWSQNSYRTAEYWDLGARLGFSF